ncbi:MAG: peptide ABC transporter substrate-binding protein, partial [Alphaproteobacteria bacterium]|nr:peptide ABC transporter substrate-binding protein [Alphaproteobacteria bacterium]
YYLHICETSSNDVNYGRYSNPRFDNLIAQSDRARETMQRAILLEQAEQVMLDDVAVAPVYFGASRGLVAKSVKGWIDNPADINRTRYLSLARDGALS